MQEIARDGARLFLTLLFALNILLSPCAVSSVNEMKYSLPSQDIPEIEILYPGLCVDGFAFPGTDSDGAIATVNDSDGVDVVIFRFHRLEDDSWTNITGSRVGGNNTDGEYSAMISWTIPWPQGGVVQHNLQVFANDSLGNWAETDEVFHHSYGYSPSFSVLVVIGILVLIHQISKRRQISG